MAPPLILRLLPFFTFSAPLERSPTHGRILRPIGREGAGEGRPLDQCLWTPMRNGVATSFCGIGPDDKEAGSTPHPNLGKVTLETRFSRHHGRPIEAPLGTIELLWCPRGFREGVLNWADVCYWEKRQSLRELYMSLVGCFSSAFAVEMLW